MDPALRQSIAQFAAAAGFSSTRPLDATPTCGEPYIPSDAFEAFATHFVLNRKRHFALPRQDILSLVTGGHQDSRIDSIAVLINGELILDEEDLAVFAENEPGTDIDVEIIFIQATLLAYLSQSKIEQFCTGVSSFVSSADGGRLQENDNVRQWRRLIDQVLELLESRHPGKKPVGTLYLVWPNQKSLSSDHHSTLAIRRADLDRLGFFERVDCEIVNGDELLELVRGDLLANSGTLCCKDLMQVEGTTFNSDEGSRCWLGYASAQAILDMVTGPEGRLDDRIFFENVRHRISRSRSNVRSSVLATLRGDCAGRFVAMNNGITIIARRVNSVDKPQLALTDYQIVNGCQTMFALHECQDVLTPEVLVAIKVIESVDANLTHDIAVATNSQTRVESVELLSREPFVRRLQMHFEATLPEHHPAHVKFERRTNEHAEWRARDGNRVLTIKDMIAGFVAVFQERPDASHNARWPALVAMVPDQIFNPGHDPNLYRATGLILWRTASWLSANGHANHGYPARFHLALALRRIAETEPGWRGLEKGPVHAKALERYLKRLDERLLDETHISGLIASAHEAVVAAFETTETGWSSSGAKREATTRNVLFEAGKRRK